MTSCVPIIAVADVQKSASWYQNLFGCTGTHGGDVFEMLCDAQNNHFLFLHKWGAHEHPTLSEPSKQVGNGLVLYFTVADLDKVWQEALKLNASVEEEPKISENSGKMEFCIRDLDGYFLMISL